MLLFISSAPTYSTLLGDDAFLLHYRPARHKALSCPSKQPAVEFSLDGSYTIFVQLHAVHYDFVQVTDFLCHAAGFVLGGGKFFNQSLNLLAVVFCRIVKEPYCEYSAGIGLFFIQPPHAYW